MSKRIFSAFFVLVLAAAACSLPESQTPSANDPGIILTAAAQTVSAQLTSSAPQTPTVTATTEPLPGLATATVTATGITVPGPTLTPTGSCDAAQFITDVTVPDGTNFAAGAPFTKTWRIKNIGTCSWTSSYSLVFSSGEAMGGPASQPLAGTVNPGQSVDISVNLTAPSSNGNHTSYWKLRNGSGVLFTNMYVQIHVGGGGDTGDFAVTHVEYTVSGSCGHYIVTAEITTNAAGTVKYHWERKNDPDEGTFGSTLVFSSASTHSVHYDWYLSANTSTWVKLYVESPNHQFFGEADINSPGC